MITHVILWPTLIFTAITGLYLYHSNTTNEYKVFKNKSLAFWGATLASISIALFIVGGIASFAALSNSYSSVNRLESFFNDTRSAYEFAIERTENVVVDLSGTRAGSITDFSYEEQSLEVSQRIREFRDEVRDYNNQLVGLRNWNSVPFFGDFVQNVPDYLKPIMIEF